MKKILVSGCANCPYLRVYDNGSNQGFNSISHGECAHPSFVIKRDLPSAMVLTVEFLASGSGSDYNNITNVNPQGHPDWCPLPDEFRAYNPITCK